MSRELSVAPESAYLCRRVELSFCRCHLVEVGRVPRQAPLRTLAAHAKHERRRGRPSPSATFPTGGSHHGEGRAYREGVGSGWAKVRGGTPHIPVSLHPPPQRQGQSAQEKQHQGPAAQSGKGRVATDQPSARGAWKKRHPGPCCMAQAPPPLWPRKKWHDTRCTIAAAHARRAGHQPSRRRE